MSLTLGSGARRDPQIVAITTAGYDLTSICGLLYGYGQGQRRQGQGQQGSRRQYQDNDFGNEDDLL